MFTGIVEGVAPVISIKELGESAVFQLNLKCFEDDLKLGDSVSVNGCCLTVASLDKPVAGFDVMTESLKVTSLSTMAEGSQVNVERALALGERLGGHILSGHVDGCATLLSIEKQDNSSYFKFKAPSELIQDMLLRGSVSVDGVSLTICDLAEDSFTVSIIPVTLKETIFSNYQTGQQVNVETDMISKYIRSHVERLK
jgi:riboflavin synthase